MSALKRIRKELDDINKDGGDGAEKKFFASMVEGNTHAMEVAILGPKGTPYEDGTFILKFKYPGDYPFKTFGKPLMVTKIYNPMMIDKSGQSEEGAPLKLIPFESDNWNPA